MEGLHFENHTESQRYDGEKVRAEAMSEVEREMDARLGEKGESSLETRISVLRALLAEYDAVHPGTSIPLDNSKGPLVEAAASILHKAEIEKMFEDKMKAMGEPANDNTPLMSRVAA